MHSVNVGEVSFRCDLSGEGSPLVLVHGLGNDLHLWDGDMEAFSAEHAVLRFDVRGFGESDKPRGPYSTEMFARDLEGLVAAHDWDSVHVVGISMGGVIAQRFALDYPARVRSLVLVSTSSEVGEKSVRAWQRLADVVERRGFDARSADASRAFSPDFAEAHPEIVAEIGRQNAASDPNGYAAAARAVSDYNWTDRLAEIVAPVLILQGLEDRLTPPGGAVKMHRRLPRSRLLMIAGSGHNLPIEKPEVFHSAVLAFTAGVDFSNQPA